MPTTSDRTLKARPIVETVKTLGGYQHVAIVVPGIRSNADWVEMTAAETWKKWQRERLANPPLEYRKASDMRIATWRLITRIGLEQICENIKLQIDAVIEQHPETKISLICHSLGSDIIVKILPSIDYKFDHIVFLGAICKKQAVLSVRKHAFKFANGRGTHDQWPIAASLIRPDTYEPTGNFGFGLAFMKELVSNNNHLSCTNPEYIVGHVEDFIQTGCYTINQSVDFPYSLSNFTYFRIAIYMWLIITFFIFCTMDIYIGIIMLLLLFPSITLYLLPSRPEIDNGN